MQDHNDNMLYIIAKALSESPYRECYLVVGEQWEIAPQLLGLQAEIIRTLEGKKDPVLHEVIRDFYMLPGSSDVTFSDGSEAFVTPNGIAIHISARQMDHDRSVFRLLFVKMDAIALDKALRVQLASLNRRVEKLEQRETRH